MLGTLGDCLPLLVAQMLRLVVHGVTKVKLVTVQAPHTTERQWLLLQMCLMLGGPAQGDHACTSRCSSWKRSSRKQTASGTLAGRCELAVPLTLWSQAVEQRFQLVTHVLISIVVSRPLLQRQEACTCRCSCVPQHGSLQKDARRHSFVCGWPRGSSQLPNAQVARHNANRLHAGFMTGHLRAATTERRQQAAA